MNLPQDKDLLILDDISKDHEDFGKVFIRGRMIYMAGVPIYQELKETKLRVIK